MPELAEPDGRGSLNGHETPDGYSHDLGGLDGAGDRWMTRFEIARQIGSGLPGCTSWMGRTGRSTGAPAPDFKQNSAYFHGRRGQHWRPPPCRTRSRASPRRPQHVVPVIAGVHASLGGPIRDRTMNRRRFLKATAARAAPAGVAGRALCRARDRPRLLVVFLRGAYDAANIVIPVSSDFYRDPRAHLWRCPRASA